MTGYLKKIDKGNFISILMMLFLSAGFLVLNDYISSAATIAMWFLLLFYLVLGMKGFNSAISMPAFVIMLWYVLSSVINGDEIYVVLAGVFGFIVSFMYVSTKSFSDFQASYIEVMKVLCIISLVFFLAFLLFPFVSQIFSPFIRYSASNRPFYNFYFFIYNPNLTRNMGMFWEPGAFQIFINIALLFEILKSKPSGFNIAIFLATIITTFSTTGYVAVLIIIALVFLNYNQELKKTRTIFMWFLPVLIVLLVYNYAFLNDTSSYSTFGKVTRFFENEEWKDGGAESSSSVRYYSVTKTIEAFIESPIFGQGKNGLLQRNFNYTYGMNTCTFANWFGIYGIVYGLLMLIGFIRFSALLGNNKGGFVKFLILIFFFTITASEALSESPLLTILCLYGYNDKLILRKLRSDNVDFARVV